MITFNKIVNKMLKKWWKVVFKNDIFEIVDPDLNKKNSSLVNKIIYRLKAEKIIISIRNWVYIVPDSDDYLLNEIDLIEKYYYKLLKKYISSIVWNNYYISWEKSLELQLKNFEVPEKIYVINRSINKKIMIWDYTIIFKTISWNDNNKKINLYSRLSKFTTNISFDWIVLKTSCLELALLESSVIWDNINWLNISLLTKAIKKYSKVFDREIFEEIAKYKYIMSVNRLKELSKNIDKSLYSLFLDIIKRNGGLFIWEGLRWV